MKGSFQRGSDGLGVKHEVVPGIAVVRMLVPKSSLLNPKEINSEKTITIKTMLCFYSTWTAVHKP